METFYIHFFILHALSTLIMVGVIWFVQLVHYPLFVYVELTQFVDFENQHTSRISYIVVPAMLIELATSAFLLLFPINQISYILFIIGFILVMIIWASTFFIQVPRHTLLSKGFDATAHKQLVVTNWIRTIAWSLRGIFVYIMLYEVMNSISLIP